MKQEQEQPNKENEKQGNTSNPNPNPNPNPNLNPCPICLGPITQESFLDRCYHRYCYQCIIRWTQVVLSSSSSLRQPSSLKCPLCKTENYTIMYGYDGYTFQKHFIDQNNGNSHFFSKDHRYRLQCYYTEPESDPSTNLFKVEHYWKSHKYLQHSSWLEKWLRRELQALIQEEDVEIIMHHIVGVVESFSRSYHRKGKTGSPKLQEEFKSLVTDAAMPFLTARTKRFVDEMELFLASGLTVEAYDGAYRRWLAWKKPEETSEDNEETSREREARASYLYVFDDDSDEVD